MASHKLTAGFETLKELQEFNAEWETLGVFPEEIWPLPRRTFEFMLSGSDAATIVRSSDDVIALRGVRAYLCDTGLILWMGCVKNANAKGLR